MSTTFIPMATLGLVEQRVLSALSAETKRKRQAGFRECVKLLKMLNIIQKEYDVWGLSTGVHINGEPMLFISFDNAPEAVRGGAGE